MSRVLAEYGKTKYVSLIFFNIYIYSSLLFPFNLSQSVHTWWFGSDEASHNGLQGRAPAAVKHKPPLSTRARRAGRRSRRARRARASAGSASRAELGKAKKSAAHSVDTKKGCCDILYIAIIPFYCFKFQRKPRFIYPLPTPLERGEREKSKNRCKRHALKRGLVRIKCPPTGLQGRSPCANQAEILHPTTRARRAGRRSRRARRARASAGSASRAELEGGESWCKRHALMGGGLVRMKRSPTGCRCELLRRPILGSS